MTKFIPLVALLASCTSMEPSGNLLEPVRVAAQPASAQPAPPTQPANPEALPPADSPFLEDDPFHEGPTDPTAAPSGTDALLRLQLDRRENPPPPKPKTQPEPPPTPAAAIPVWDGQKSLEGAGNWGVTLLTTMLDVQPPRAVLVFPDATERVVQPGTMVPDHQMIVLAIGKNAVQIAHVEPMGFMSRVHTTTVRTLSDGG